MVQVVNVHWFARGYFPLFTTGTRSLFYVQNVRVFNFL